MSKRAVTRSSIAQSMGLSRSTVAQRLDSLFEANLIIESEDDQPSGGRPTKVLRFNNAAGYVICVDVGEERTRIALADLSPRILLEQVEMLDVKDGPEAMLDKIIKTVSMMIGLPEISGKHMVGFGLGLPAPVDYEAGRVRGWSIMSGWDGYDIRAKLATKEAAKKDGIKLELAAGKADGDEATQVTAIENAIARGDKGILITVNGPGVNTAIKKARDAGLLVIALDTPTEPADAVDVTFATDNFAAGKAIGEWSAKKMNGKPVVIALIDAFSDKIITVDYNRDQGFLTGMGIDVKDAKKNGDEAKTGNYSGGTYTIACNQPGMGSEDGGRTAMENCLSKNPNINLVYTLNEPTASGANKALVAANKKATMVSVDGGCDPGMTLVKSGVIGATSQQYPLKMASLGVDAIAKYAKDGTKPTTTSGLDFFDTGVNLVTDDPQDGVKSITSTEGLAQCWGSKA